MRKSSLILIFILIMQHSYSITFHIPIKKDKPINFKVTLDAGVGFEGSVSNHSGIRDFNSVFIRPAFFIQGFGVGFNFTFRFRNFPEILEFQKADWQFNDEIYKTICKIIDMVDFIEYTTPYHTFQINTGEIPYLTVGNGLLINQFHNRFFAPSDKQHGVFMQLDFTSDFMKQHIPFDIPLKIQTHLSDIVDPDLIFAGVDFDFSPYLPVNDLTLETQLFFGIDLDADESNVLSGESITNITHYRDLDWDKQVGSATLSGLATYTFDNLARMELSLETACVWNDTGNFSGALSIMGKGWFFELENSGFLLGVPFGIITKNDHFYTGYFGLNYENVRREEYLHKLSESTALFQYGIELSGLKESVQFKLLLTSPFVMENYTAKYEAYFILNGIKGTFAENLSMAFRYQSAMKELDINGSGGNFLESITDKFRLAIEVDYKIYNARLRVSAGLQTPNWMEYIPIGGNGYAEMQNGLRIVDLDTYGKYMLKFIRMEVAIGI